MLDVATAPTSGEEVAYAAAGRPRLDLRVDFGHGGELLRLPRCRTAAALLDEGVERRLRVLLEGLRARFVIHHRDGRGAAEAGDERSAIDLERQLHELPPGQTIRRALVRVNEDVSSAPATHA